MVAVKWAGERNGHLADVQALAARYKVRLRARAVFLGLRGVASSTFLSRQRARAPTGTVCAVDATVAIEAVRRIPQMS